MVKRNFTVEIGRVCIINNGALNGKVCAILDVVDQSRALIDGPASLTGVTRQTIPLTHLSLTPLTVKIARSVKSSTLAKAFEAQDILNKYSQCGWAKKADRSAKRAACNDFGRFKAMILKKKRTSIVRRELTKLKRSSK